MLFKNNKYIPIEEIQEKLELLEYCDNSLFSFFLYDTNVLDPNHRRYK